MMAVAVRAGPTVGTKPTLEADVPRPLFETHLVQIQANFLYDVTADGKRFLLASTAGGPAPAPVLNMVVNWVVGLKK